MPTYFYTARSQTGQIKTGTLSVADKRALADALIKEGYLLTLVRQEKLKERRSLDISSFFKGVPLIEKVMFTRHLAVMLGAGISISRGLGVLAEQTKSNKFKKVILDIQTRVQKGDTLAASFAGHPDIFNQLFISMVRVGETGGNLENVLNLLATQMKKDYDLISKVKGAMVYPAVVIIAMLGVGVVIMVYVMPKLVGLFEEMNVPLPPLTKLIIEVSKFFQKYILFIIPGILGLGAFLKWINRKKENSGFLDKLLMRIPIASGLVRKINIARFARNLGSLLKGGVSITESLRIVSDTLSIDYKLSLVSAASQIEKGLNLSNSFVAFPRLYPPLVWQMIKIGEETGTLDDILERIAEFYEQEVDDILKNLSSIIEPVLMILIGIVVGLFAISVIQPMYAIMESV